MGEEIAREIDGQVLEHFTETAARHKKAIADQLGVHPNELTYADYGHYLVLNGKHVAERLMNDQGWRLLDG